MNIVVVVNETINISEDHVITPEAGALTLTGYPAEFVVVRPAPVTQPVPTILAWLDSTAVFIPRSVREPFFGDLREDLTEKRAAGWSSTWITWVAVSQVVILVVKSLWSSGLVRTIVRGGS